MDAEYDPTQDTSRKMSKRKRQREREKEKKRQGKHLKLDESVTGETNKKSIPLYNPDGQSMFK